MNAKINVIFAENFAKILQLICQTSIAAGGRFAIDYVSVNYNKPAGEYIDYYGINLIKRNYILLLLDENKELADFLSKKFHSLGNFTLFFSKDNGFLLKADLNNDNLTYNAHYLLAGNRLEVINRFETDKIEFFVDYIKAIINQSACLNNYNFSGNDQRFIKGQNSFKFYSDDNNLLNFFQGLEFSSMVVGDECQTEIGQGKVSMDNKSEEIKSNIDELLVSKNYQEIFSCNVSNHCLIIKPNLQNDLPCNLYYCFMIFARFFAQDNFLQNLLRNDVGARFLSNLQELDIIEQKEKLQQISAYVPILQKLDFNVANSNPKVQNKPSWQAQNKAVLQNNAINTPSLDAENKIDNQRISCYPETKLIGIDITINIENYIIDDLLTKIELVTCNTRLKLQFMAINGQLYYPRPTNFVAPISDLAILRFLPFGEDKTANNIGLADLYLSLVQHNIDILSSNNLYIVDGKLGFAIFSQS